MCEVFNCKAESYHILERKISREKILYKSGTNRKLLVMSEILWKH